MRLTIKAKLAAVFTVVVAISAGSMFIAMQNLGSLNDSPERIINVPAAISLTLADMRRHLESVGSRVRAMIISDDPVVIADYVTKLADERKEVNDLYAKLDGNVAEEISAGSREQNAGAAQINTAIQQLDKVTQQNTFAAEQMSATSEELVSQAEQLQSAISYFRIDDRQAAARTEIPVVVKGKATRASLRSEIMARAPHMTRKTNGAAKANAGGFELSLDDAHDDLDGDFARRSA